MANKSLSDELQDYMAMFVALKEVVDEIPEEMQTKRPQPDKWSVKELVCHIVDAELNYALRMMKVIAEENPFLSAYDHELWAKNLFYKERDMKESLLLFGILRNMIMGIAHNLPEKAWKLTGKHEETGNITLREILETANNHCKHHLAQIVAVKINVQKSS